MANRRIPLANNPTAANSPFRNVAPLAGKRPRPQSTDPRDILHGQPPLKRQLLDIGNDENTPPRSFTRQSLSEKEAEGKLFVTRKPTNAPLTAFERKLVAAREKKPNDTQQVSNKSPDKTQKTIDGLEHIRQWQAHYKTAFPRFVFYFESVPEDARRKISAQVQALGAVSPVSSSLTDHLALLTYYPAHRKKKSSSPGRSRTSSPPDPYHRNTPATVRIMRVLRQPKQRTVIGLSTLPCSTVNWTFNRRRPVIF